MLNWFVKVKTTLPTSHQSAVEVANAFSGDRNDAARCDCDDAGHCRDCIWTTKHADLIVIIITTFDCDHFETITRDEVMLAADDTLCRPALITRMDVLEIWGRFIGWAFSGFLLLTFESRMPHQMSEGCLAAISTPACAVSLSPPPCGDKKYLPCHEEEKDD